MIIKINFEGDADNHTPDNEQTTKNFGWKNFSVAFGLTWTHDHTEKIRKNEPCGRNVLRHQPSQVSNRIIGTAIMKQFQSSSGKFKLAQGEVVGGEERQLFDFVGGRKATIPFLSLCDLFTHGSNAKGRIAPKREILLC